MGIKKFKPMTAGTRGRTTLENDLVTREGPEKSLTESLSGSGGRNHHGKVFSALVAGGGFRGGSVVGASDARGEEVLDRPVHPADLIGSVYALLGIDAGATLPHPQGLTIPLVLPPEDRPKTAGILNEIMG